MRNGAGYAKKYLEQSDYYAEGERKVVGEWFGRGAEILAIAWETVHDEQFERLRLGLHPNSGEQLRERKSPAKENGQENHGRSLYDFTFSAPKSLSLMAILGGDDRLIGVHNRAVRIALEEVERHAAARVRVNHQNSNRTTGNLIAACYTHLDSRRLDPQVHTHCVAANMSWDHEEGKWKALQAGPIYARTALFTEVYRSELARGLAIYGYEMERGKNGPEIKGVPQSLIDQFSQGSRDREAAIAEFVIKAGRPPTKNEITILVRDARPDKMVHISTEEVRAQQLARLTPDDERTIAQVRDRADRNRNRFETHEAADSLAYALGHTFERVSVARDFTVLTEALKHGRGHVALDELKEALATVEANGTVIRAGDDIATRWSLEREIKMIRTINQGRGGHERMGKDLNHFEVSPKLNAEQRDVVEFVLNSRDFAVNIEGAAGTGKTTTLNELRRGLQAGGRLMVAVAPTQSAADELRKTGFQNAMTIERLLASTDEHPMLSGRAIIVDEAAMVSGRQMDELLDLAKRFDARIIFSGDTRQIQSVEASDALRILLKDSQLASIGLREVQRQEPKDYKDAIETLRTDPARGFHKLEDMGVVKTAGLLDRADEVAKAYREAKGTAVVVCPTHEEINRVTDAIRADLIEQKKLGAQKKLDRLEPLNWTDAQKQDVRNFVPGQVLVFHKGTKQARKYEAVTVTAQEGDHIVARNSRGKDIELTRKQARCFGVFEKRSIDVAVGDWLSIQGNVNDDVYQFTNGERVKVKKVNDRGSILLTDGRTIPHRFNQYTHGYAITAHKAQGKTVDEVIISGDRFSQELFYVAASRGKKRITIFTGDKEALRESIGVSGERMSALELARLNAVTVDRTRSAERPRTLAERIGQLMEKVWLNIPRLVLGDRFAPAKQGVEMGR